LSGSIIYDFHIVVRPYARYDPDDFESKNRALPGRLKSLLPFLGRGILKINACAVKMYKG